MKVGDENGINAEFRWQDNDEASEISVCSNSYFLLGRCVTKVDKHYPLRQQS